MGGTAEDRELIIPLAGKIDSSNAAEVEQEVFAALDGAPDGASDGLLVFDAADLDYISSAGLRVLLRATKAHGGSSEIRNVSPEVYEILEMTGFTEILGVRKRMREVSVDGCEVIGRGFYGTVYRIDEDTIVKVYSSPDSIPLIEHERAMAKLAFVKGVPTAISYDIVKVSDSYGSVFELLRAKTLNTMLIEQPERAEEIIAQFADLMRQVHAIKMDPGELPSAKEAWFGYVDGICGSGLIPPDQGERLRELLRELPDTDGVVHGDFHMKNVMVSDGEPMLIDMDTLSQGHPIFDLQGVFVTYKAFREDDPTNSMDFLGISGEMADLVWEKTLERYFGTDDREQLARFSDRICLVAYVRFLNLTGVPDFAGDELWELRVQHTREHIAELLGRVDSLDFA